MGRYRYSGVLTLVPTPISSDKKIHSDAFEVLSQIKENDIVLVEEHKTLRRGWIAWGLDRAGIEQFEIYNEHNIDEKNPWVIAQLKSGRNIYLLSEAGIPAFCDPGAELIGQCHDQGIRVTSTAFENSIALAIALSGFSISQFWFEGFLPQKSDERKNKISELLKNKSSWVLMDTPYRLKKTLDEIQMVEKQTPRKRSFFLACDLNSSEEVVFRGQINDLVHKTEGLKKPFILIASSI